LEAALAVRYEAEPDKAVTMLCDLRGTVSLRIADSPDRSPQCPVAIIATHYVEDPLSESSNIGPGTYPPRRAVQQHALEDPTSDVVEMQ
jgi:hypothetical protein